MKVNPTLHVSQIKPVATSALCPQAVSSRILDPSLIRDFCQEHSNKPGGSPRGAH